MKSIQKIVEEQAHRWQLLHAKAPEAPRTLPVVTVSREPGSGGKLVAQGIAEELGLDLFHQEVIHEMAKSAKVSMRLLETLDEKGLTVLEEYISSLVHREHLWPDGYLKQLLKVIGTIGGHGRAVIVGRGANYVLPADHRFRIRVIAPKAFRASKVAAQFDISPDEALRRIIRTGSDRKAFVRKYFNKNISDPLNYDMILNTGTMSISHCVSAVCAALI
ncbi:MAG: cytidylate kinase-like family protein [Desulfobacteraceae bacterium]|nr:cytidylate kinase-like family protein [Desulfobacteraceae bacterium]